MALKEMNFDSLAAMRSPPALQRGDQPLRDTIFALSSGRPPAAVAVIRISGPGAGEGLSALAGKLPEPRRATLRTLRHPSSREPIDQALVLWFPAPKSETAEDMAELQVHGGRAVLAATLDALASVPGLRPAEAGEFTRRAFENGRMDLTAVEGLADLIGAETEAQRRQALRQLQGLLGGRAEAWRARLIEAQALVEAGIDFPDEGDVGADVGEAARGTAAALLREINDTLRDSAHGERLRDGVTIAIAGPVNAGKSSLFNRLARRDAAIVSPNAGTTRDVLELRLDLAGLPVTVLDTAGMRESDDPVEREGVRRARARAAEADLVLWVTDAGERSREPPPARAWPVYNKLDVLGPAARGRLESGDGRAFAVSALDGTGIDRLVAALEQFSREALAGAESALITRTRHRHLLNEAAQALQRGLAAPSEELFAEELRLAARALGRLVGRVDVEDILDALFREFCIGK